ncbi:hypothetical protein G7Z17_g1936 [Cylindrodendrum hubeiense]|uniref:Glutathione S-transferase n=1 Tax=Cylindrodendrum hubeiense TaxID=595255 RepID=A0A9P5HFA0_9HYPO|nr:hypothetical protein G7Z17_g1936 [Cylindrodendrum hubeiense]
MILSIPKVVVGLWLCTASVAYHFQPDKHDTWKNTRSPSLIDLSEDQNSGSYWSSAFVTATTGQQFLIVHHQFSTICKSSVLDLQTLKYSKHVDHCEITDATRVVTPDYLSITFPNLSIVADVPDKISELQLSAKSPDYSFSLDVEARTSKVLLNGGNGVIAWGPGYSNCSHWSIPAARTSGKLTLGEKKPLTLDPSKSFTWYDHQITNGVPSNFTWFEFHFPDPSIRVSVWAYDWPESSDSWRYATVRLGEETNLVLPYTLSADWDNAWVSPLSGRKFPQSWTLKFENGDYLRVNSVKEDQEAAADITLYTNHRCPWAHRAHIVLAELGIPFKEEIIDLDTPRTPEYLKVNPRGQVPTLSYNGEIITESAIVAQFLADAYPSHLLPSTTDKNGPLVRARIAFFVDAWFSRVQSHYGKVVFAKSDSDAEVSAKDIVAAIAKEVEPLLTGAAPFFGGNEKITLAEVLIGPFILRIFSLSKAGVIPESIAKELPDAAPRFYQWAQAVIQQPAVLSIYNEEKIVESTKNRVAKLRA